MKIKTALTLSLVVNAVLVAAVAYIALSPVPVQNDPVIIINRGTTSEPSRSAATTEPAMAGLPN
jgi:cytochrome oxidase assembly protein ShyY1